MPYFSPGQAQRSPGYAVYKKLHPRGGAVASARQAARNQSGGRATALQTLRGGKKALGFASARKKALGFASARKKALGFASAVKNALGIAAVGNALDFGGGKGARLRGGGKRAGFAEVENALAVSN